MNEELQKFARDTIKKGLAECSDDQQMVFKRMYSHMNLNMPINDVVDKMPSDRLDWAMTQLKNTISKNEKSDKIYG